MTKKIVLFDLRTGGHHIKYVLYLAQYLCELGYEVTFITLKADIRTKLLPNDKPGLTVRLLSNNTNVHVRRNFVARYFQMLGALEKCFKFANEWGADVVSIMQLDYNELAIMTEVLRRKNPSWRLFGFLVWPHFLYGPDEHASLLRKAYYSLTAAVSKHLLKKEALSGMFVHTTAIKQALIERFSWENSGYKNNLVAVPDPTESFYGCCSMKEARDRLQLPVGIPILLFFGRLRWDKGPDVLLEAISNIREDVVLVIAGQPGYVTQSDIEKHVKKLKGVRIMARIGYIPEEDVKYYFLSADAVILPYRRAFKGTSGILQNAASAGKPVITTDVGEIGRIVRENSLGIIVEPESPYALQQGIQNFLRSRKEVEERVIENAISYAKQHSWRKMAEIVESSFRKGIPNGEESGNGD